MENTLIDTLVFDPPLEMEYEKVIGMFSSDHERDCCESHELCIDEAVSSFETAKSFLKEVKKIEIKGVDGMGIVLRLSDGLNEFGIFIPGRGYNNGYYSSEITLYVDMPSGVTKEYDCTNFQEIEG